MNLKAQVGAKEVMVTLVIAGLIAIIGVLVFSNVSTISNSLFDNEQKTTKNESVTISVTNSNDNTNSTLLTNDGYLTNTEQVRNASNSILLVRNVDYKIALVGGASGELATKGNFTLLNVSHFCNAATCPNGAVGDTNTTGFNNTALKISYNTNEKSTGRLSKETMDTTVLDSLSLGAIALIVLAAVLILSSLFMLGNK